MKGGAQLQWLLVKIAARANAVDRLMKARRSRVSIA
jgi:hypothetical protein